MCGAASPPARLPLYRCLCFGFTSVSAAGKEGEELPAAGFILGGGVCRFGGVSGGVSGGDGGGGGRVEAMMVERSSSSSSRRTVLHLRLKHGS